MASGCVGSGERMHGQETGEGYRCPCSRKAVQSNHGATAHGGCHRTLREVDEVRRVPRA